MKLVIFKIDGADDGYAALQFKRSEYSLEEIYEKMLESKVLNYASLDENEEVEWSVTVDREIEVINEKQASAIAQALANVADWLSDYDMRKHTDYATLLVK